MSETSEAAPEFSRPVAVNSLGEAATAKQITANEAERAALARRFDLLSLDQLSADLRVQRLPGKGVIRVSGRFEAAVVQACVVSLEPVPARLSVAFEQLYVLAPAAPRQRELVIDAEVEDPPEVLSPGGLDLGETVVQQLALALDPYPRAPGAQAPASSEEAIAAARNADSPFAVLKTLKGSG
jgi:uncharacterized metal-binding protein YceD (DUF177 family)